MTANATPRRPTRPQAAVIAVVVVATIALGAGLIMRPDLRSAPGPSSATAASPGASPAAASPGASPAADWAGVEVGALPVVATLEATTQDIAGVAPTTTFALASRSGEPVRAIAERLEVSPTAQFTVAPSADGRSATLTPKAALTAGRTYRVTLRTQDGAPAGSWAFHVRGPVAVTSTVPGDATTDVPVQTGIELTFDQDDVASMESHFAISPAVRGRFEQHGRTQVFVPDKLEPATLYTVTIRHGLARTGTDLTLAKDVIFRFETQGQTGPAATRLRFARDVLEVGPGQRPVVGVIAIVPQLDENTSAPAPRTASVKVYRIPSLKAAGATLSAFLAAPRWAEFMDPTMPTDGLPVVARFDSSLEALSGDALLLRFPEALPVGWYIIEIPGPRPSQAFLQVTPVSAWVAVLSDRTVVWVNDVTTGKAVGDATVTLDGGGVVGRSGANGLVIAATPAGIVPPAVADTGAEAPPASPILRVTSPAGRTVFIPFGVGGSGDVYRGEWYEKTAPADATYWAVLYTDRGIYRRDDSIDVWGYLRGRDDGRVPASVAVRLVSQANGQVQGAPGIVTSNAATRIGRLVRGDPAGHRPAHRRLYGPGGGR